MGKRLKFLNIIYYIFLFSTFFQCATAPGGPGSPNHRGFTITLRQTALSRTPLDKWPARHRDLYLTAHNTHKRQIYLPPEGTENRIPASDRWQSHALDRAATPFSTENNINEICFACKLGNIFDWMWLHLEFRDRFSQKVPCKKFHEIFSNVSTARACGQTDIHEKS
jgi:hypothetical protein